MNRLWTSLAYLISLPVIIILSGILMSKVHPGVFKWIIGLFTGYLIMYLKNKIELRGE